MAKFPLGWPLVYVVLELSRYLIAGYFPKIKLPPATDIIITLVLYFVVVRVGVFLVLDLLWAKRRQAKIPKITRDLTLIIGYLVAAAVVLKQKTDVDLGSLIATSAVLSLVIGLALQDTLGNFFSGLALQIEKPYEIGDWVNFDPYTGQVVGVTWKSTLIRTGLNDLVYVPNNIIFKSPLKNLSKPTPDVVSSIEIGAGYNDPPNKVIQVLKELMLSHPGVLKEPPPTVRMTTYADFSINYKMFFRVASYPEEPAVKSDLMGRIWYLFKREGITIPYPVQEEFSRVLPEDTQEKQRRADLKTTVALLSSVGILKPLGPEVLQKLAEDSPLLDFGTGEEIVRQGEEGDSLFLIKSGACGVWVAKGGHEQERVATLQAGQCFGEMALLTGEKRSATVRAASDMQVVKIDKVHFTEILSTHPGILETLGQILAERQAQLQKALSQQEATLASRAQEASRFVNRMKAFFGMK